VGQSSHQHGDGESGPAVHVDITIGHEGLADVTIGVEGLSLTTDAAAELSERLGTALRVASYIIEQAS
jgi:hypothetical protein